MGELPASQQPRACSHGRAGLIPLALSALIGAAAVYEVIAQWTTPRVARRSAPPRAAGRPDRSADAGPDAAAQSARRRATRAAPRSPAGDPASAALRHRRSGDPPPCPSQLASPSPSLPITTARHVDTRPAADGRGDARHQLSRPRRGRKSATRTASVCCVGTGARGHERNGQRHAAVRAHARQRRRKRASVWRGAAFDLAPHSKATWRACACPRPTHGTLSHRASSHARRGRRHGHDRRRRADRRAVDDQHRHRRRRGDGRAGEGAGGRRLRARARDRKHGRGRGRGRRRSARSSTRSDAACRSWATSISTATSCSRRCPTAGARSRSSASTPATSGKGSKRDPQFATMIEQACLHAQAGSHRRQLGQPRRRSARAADGRERASPSPASRRCGDARSDRHVGARQRATRRGARPCRRSHRAVLQGVERAGPDHRLPRACAPLPITRCISGSPKRAWAARASSRRPPRCRCCCRKGSATRSGSRSRPSRAATARRKSSSRRRSCRRWACARSRRW